MWGQFQAARLYLVACALITTSACGSDGGVGPEGTSSFFGTFAASGQAGRESGVFQASSTRSGPASGMLEFTTGQTTTLSGERIPFTGQFTLSGGGYTFSGEGGFFGHSGTYTGPRGSGRFVATRTEPGEIVTVYCGEYSGSGSGVWILGRSTSLAGVAADDDGTARLLTGGILTDNSINIVFEDGSATGSLTSATEMSGTWRIPTFGTVQKSGSWSASTTNC